MPLDPDDPLLPYLHEQLEAGPGPRRMERLTEAVYDYVNLNQIALPAFDSAGRPIVPPDEHVLDWIARAEDLVEEEVQWGRLAAGTVAVVAESYACDLCGAPGRYDAAALADTGRPAAFLCTECFRREGHTSLGASGDGYLMLTAEVSAEVREVVDELRHRLGKPTKW